MDRVGDWVDIYRHTAATHPRSHLLGQLYLSQVLHFSVWVKYCSSSHGNSSPPRSRAHRVSRIRIPRPQSALHGVHADH